MGHTHDAPCHVCTGVPSWLDLCLWWVLLLLLHALCPLLPGVVPFGGTAAVQSANGQLNLRHCNFQVFAYSGFGAPLQDFDFTIVTGLSGTPGSVSFQSVNFPT